MSHQDQLPAGAGDGNIQTPIVENKAGAARADERQYHDIALAALEPLHGIDRYPGPGEHLAQQHDLRTEW